MKNRSIIFSLCTCSLLAIFAFICLTFFNSADANSIDSISMDIAIDNNGNASVTEYWKCYANQGSEIYHPYYNLGNSVISNLSVYDIATIPQNRGYLLLEV